MLLERNAVHLVFGHKIATGEFALNAEFGEVDVELQHLQAWLRLERDAKHLSLTVRIGGEPHHLAARLSLRKVVFTVAGHACNGKSLHIHDAAASVLIEHIVDGARVVALKHIQVNHILTHIYLLAHLNHLKLTIFVENDDVVDVGAVAHKFVFLQSGADKAVGTVDVEFFVSLSHLRSHDGVEIANDGAARELVAVFLFQSLKPLDGVFHQVSEFVVDVGNALVESGDVIISLVDVELQDSAHLDFEQAENVVARDVAHKLRLEWVETLVDVIHGSVEVLRLFVATILIDALLDEDFFERGVKQRFESVGTLILQIRFQDLLGAVHAVAQQFAHVEELRLLVLNHTAARRNAGFAVAERVERVDSLVARRARLECDDDFGCGGSVVFHLFDFDFTLFGRFQD